MRETIIHDNVEAQAQWAINNDMQGACVYNSKGDIPSISSMLHPDLHALLDVDKEKEVADGMVILHQPAQQQAWAPPRETASGVPAARKNATGERTSGTREVIFAKADLMWQAAGKPTDKKLILLLRRDIMDALELDGVKRNTSSNTLGVWQKERIS